MTVNTIKQIHCIPKNQGEMRTKRRRSAFGVSTPDPEENQEDKIGNGAQIKKTKTGIGTDHKLGQPR